MDTKDNSNILRIGVIFLFGTLIVISFVFISNKGLFIKTINYIRYKTDIKNVVEPYNGWKEFNSEVPKFSVKYPKTLTVHDMGQSARYYHFVKFEEDVNSLDRGIAIGVTEAGAATETRRIVEEFESYGTGVLSEQKGIEVQGSKGLSMTYKPKEESVDVEAKSIAIFEQGKYTFSVSTTPDQIDKVLNSMKFGN